MAMQQRRHQQPTVKPVGKYWEIIPWVDVFEGGVHTRKQKRIKVALVTMHKREAQKIADEIMRPFNQGHISIGAAINFRDYVEREYIPGALRLLASSTQVTYQGAIRKYLMPCFADLCLREIANPRPLKQFFAAMASDGASYPTIAKTRDALSSILRSAVEDELLLKNPLDGLKLPPDKRARRRKPIITPAEFHLLIECIPEPYASAVFVCTLTGLRVSELLALKWRCIHDDAIDVQERFHRGDWSCPKTEASAALIPVHPVVIARLERLKTLTVEVRAGRAVRRHKLVKSAGPDDLVFQSVWKGRPLSDGNVLKRFIRPAARKLGLYVNWRCLRTSHATWLVQAGADPKSVQGQMRHSRISTTMDIYAQIVSSAQRRAVEQLSAFVNDSAPNYAGKLVTNLSQ